jgi:hypothetical protein
MYGVDQEAVHRPKYNYCRLDGVEEPWTAMKRSPFIELPGKKKSFQ